MNGDSIIAIKYKELSYGYGCFLTEGSLKASKPGLIRDRSGEKYWINGKEKM